jgi:hypothetical protein
VIPDVKYTTFLSLLEYIYTDYVAINKDTAMELFSVADRFAIDRLKTLCERVMLSAIQIDTAAEILLYADFFNAVVSLSLSIKLFVCLSVCLSVCLFVCQF